MTINFKGFLEELDFDDYENQSVKINDNKYMGNSLTLPGAKIFDLMFKGTEFQSFDDDKDEVRKMNLKDFVTDIQPIFETIMTDIATLTAGAQMKTNIETWFEILKRVVQLRKENPFEPDEASTKHGKSARLISQEEKRIQSYVSSGKNSQTSITSTGEAAANEFYVHIYDEQQRNAQQKFRSSRNFSMDAVTSRKLGFWCFNAAYGMRTIAALKPRSIILTSGTLSPMDSF